MVQPMTYWRLAKSSGLVKFRQTLRQTILFPLYVTGFLGSWLLPYPGDDDYVKPEKLEIQMLLQTEAERIVARQMSGQIREFMNKLLQSGMLGEVLQVRVSDL